MVLENVILIFQGRHNFLLNFILLTKSFQELRLSSTTTVLKYKIGMFMFQEQS